jgi:hypothetical protein
MASAADNRVMRLWASHEERAKHYRRLAVFFGVLLVIAMAGLYRAYGRELDVVRVDGNGQSTVVRLDRESNQEPNELELRAFGAEVAVYLCRADSWSVVNDYAWVARRMIPRLREQFNKEVMGTSQKTGAIAIIESLKRRTEIDASTLKVEADKSEYPWKVVVEGERQILGEEGARATQPFKVRLEVVRGKRTLSMKEGLLVWNVVTEGDPITGPIAPSSDTGGQS